MERSRVPVSRYSIFIEPDFGLLYRNSPEPGSLRYGWQAIRGPSSVEKTDTEMDNFRVEEMFKTIIERLDSIDGKIVVKKQRVHPLDGDALLDNQDMCQLLGVTKRTLARYRQKKLVSYYMIDGRTYYKASEVQTFLTKKGKDMPPFAPTPTPEKSNHK